MKKKANIKYCELYNLLTWFIFHYYHKKSQKYINISILLFLLLWLFKSKTKVWYINV